MPAPRFSQQRDDNEDDIINTTMDAHQLKRDYYRLFRPGFHIPDLSIKKMKAAMGFDLQVLHSQMMAVEVKNPKHLPKSGNIYKMLTNQKGGKKGNNELKTRAEFLSCGVPYHIVVYPNDLCFILGLPLQANQPLSSPLVCTLENPCICAKCASTFEPTGGDFGKCSECGFTHLKPPDKPKLVKVFIKDPKA